MFIHIPLKIFAFPQQKFLLLKKKGFIPNGTIDVFAATLLQNNLHLRVTLNTARQNFPLPKH